MLGQAIGNFGLTWFITVRTRGKPPPSPIYYIICLSAAPTSEGLFVSGQGGVPKLSQFGLLGLCEVITFCLDLRLGWGLKQTCSSPQEVSIRVLHLTCTHRGQVDSWLLMVENQTASLTPDPSFYHNLCYKCSNGPCEAIFDIHTLISFQWYK